MAVTAKTETLERELLHRESANQGRQVTFWVIGVAAVLIGLAVALWAQWQPVERSAAITQSQTIIREAPALTGQPGRITYTNVQAREALAGLGGTPAQITYTNVQAREAVAGLERNPRSDHLHQRPGSRSAGCTRRDTSPHHLLQRPGTRGGGRTGPATSTDHLLGRPGSGSTVNQS